MSQPTLYEILSLSPHSDLTPAIIKQAYRRALLIHHPDKSNSHKSSSQQTSNPNGQTKPLYTIDQISLAYTTLSSPSLRTQYDASLRTQRAQQSSLGKGSHGHGSLEEDFQTGIDTIDLDDMTFISAEDGQDGQDGNGSGKDTWYRPCRCGDERGFSLTEEDLEENADLGEVLVQCADCTIWLRVIYVVAEDEDEEEGEGR